MGSNDEQVSLDLPDVGERALLGVACRYCGSDRTYIEMRLESSPLGTFSLAGVAMKTTAHAWPWAVCDGCQHESRGEVG